MSTDISVLLIEDSFSDAQLVEALVSSSDLERPTLDHAERFREALAMLALKEYDLVLLDLQLPDGEGVGLIKQLKQQVPTVPVVVLTGIKDQTTETAALKEGAEDYVIKSDTFSPSRLSHNGHTDVGNELVQRMQFAIKRARLMHQLDNISDNDAEINKEQEGIWDWDFKGNCVYFSPSWQARMGLNAHSIVSKPEEWLARIHPEDRARFDRRYRAIQKAAQQNSTVNIACYR